MKHFAFPYAGAWAVAHVVPGTGVIAIDCTCRTYEAARDEAQRMTRMTA